MDIYSRDCAIRYTWYIADSQYGNPWIKAPPKLTLTKGDLIWEPLNQGTPNQDPPDSHSPGTDSCPPGGVTSILSDWPSGSSRDARRERSECKLPTAYPSSQLSSGNVFLPWRGRRERERERRGEGGEGIIHIYIYILVQMSRYMYTCNVNMYTCKFTHLLHKY